MQRISSPLVTSLSSLALAVLFVLIALLGWQQSRQAFEQSLAQESASLRTAFEVALSDLEQQMLGLATLIAAAPQVQELFWQGRLAVEQEGGWPRWGAGGAAA